MTDFTNNSNEMSASGKRNQPSTSEYRVYSALIRLAALPICSLIWTFSLVRHIALPAKGPLSMAWSEARTITPRIFWA